MNDRNGQSMDEKVLAEWVRELPPVEADSGFRENLRSDFASGRFADVDEQPRGRVVTAPRFRWLRLAVPLAAAVAILFALVFYNKGPALRVAVVTGSGEVIVDGLSVAASEPDFVHARLDAGTEVQLPADVTLDLVAGDVVLYELTGGSRLTIPQTPGRWFDRAAACSLFVGEIRLKTGSDFTGSELRVYTPEGLVVVTGTLVSIQCDSGGTCVCVLEGTAQVGVDTGDLQPVSPGFRKIMLRDGTVDIIPVKPMHRDGVLDFDKRVGNRIKANSP